MYESKIIIRKRIFGLIRTLTKIRRPGLDPAKPLFGINHQRRRLQRNDAKLVKVLHSNGGESFFNYGHKDKLGHVDIYLNNGDDQPGCDGLIESIVSSKIKLNY